MKKILSLILAGLMTLSCAAFVAADDAAAAEEEVVTAEDYALEFLVNKNIWKGTSAEELIADAESNVERWQMALLVSRISTGWLDDEQWEDDVANDSTFTDLEGTVAENYLGAISYANQNGIIEGYSAEKFGPEDNITYRDGLTMAVRTLGYKGLNYPWGYIEKAVELGLTEGIDKAYTHDLTRGEVAVILYNAMFAETKSGDTLAKTIFDVDFGWENIVIVANRNGYFGPDSSVKGTCPAGYVGFRVLLDDGVTLGDKTYYVDASELGADTKKREDLQMLGEVYCALFEVSEGDIVNMVDSYSLLVKTVWNDGKSKNVKFELMKYNLVDKYYANPYISEAAKDELILFGWGNIKTVSSSGKNNIALDLDTMNILQKSGSTWKIVWWFDQINNRYYKVRTTVTATGNTDIVIDYLDQTQFEEWYAEAVKTDSTRWGYLTDYDTDTAYAKLDLYDLDGDGTPDRGMYKTYKMGMISIFNEPWDWAGSQSAGMCIAIDYWEYYSGAKDHFDYGVAMQTYESGTYIWNIVQDWSIQVGEDVTEFEDMTSFMKWMDTQYAASGVDPVYLLHYDNVAKNIEILRAIYPGKEDEDNTMITGMVKGYSITEKGDAKVNIDGKIYPLGYADLEGTVLGAMSAADGGGSYVTEQGLLTAKYLNDYLYKVAQFTIVDGRIIDIDEAATGYEDEAIIVLGYAGITAKDNLVAVYGYSTMDIAAAMADGKEPEVKLFKIASFNGWHKGDYKYYPLNALCDEAFAAGSIYLINNYDEATDSYHVETNAAADLMAQAQTVGLVEFERGYMINDGSVSKMSANDKYVFVYGNGDVGVYSGIVENDNWKLENVKYLKMAIELNDDDEEISWLNVFFVEDDDQVVGFDTGRGVDYVIVTDDSVVLEWAYDSDITDDAFLGAGDYLMGSVQLKKVITTSLIDGAEVTAAVANNIDLEVGKIYRVVGNTILAEVEPLKVDEMVQIMKDLHWDAEQADGPWSIESSKFVISETTLTMTKGGAWDWWADTDAALYGAAYESLSGWIHPEIADDIIVEGGYNAFFRYVTDADGYIVGIENVRGEVEGGSWNGETHNVLAIYNPANGCHGMLDLGIVEEEAAE